MKAPTTPFLQLERNFKALMKRLPKDASIIAQGHFVDNFTRQGYYDSGGALIKWKGRGSPRFGPGRAILIQSGQLRRSLKIAPGINTARVVAEAPHARLHNRGGELKITPKMRKYFWAMYYKSGGGKAKGRSQRASVQNSTANYYRALALAKGPLRIPARPFMVGNPVLHDQIRQYTFNQLRTIFKS